MTTSVAIIIVTYKTAQLTVDCLRSIQDERQNVDFAITAIVVDNSGEDYSAIRNAIAENGWASWAEVACTPRNGGFAYGNNFGAELTRKRQRVDFIHLLNPDTLVRRGGVAELVHFLQHNKEAGIVGSGLENLDGSDWPFAFRFPSLLSEIEEGLQFGVASKLLEPWIVARTMRNSPEKVDWVPGASMMIRSSVFDAVGGLDEHYFLYFEETDFCFRASQRGYQTWYVPQSRIMHIAGQSTKVTERDVKARRLPRYWFESRRRFFVSSYGVSYAVVTDICALIARSLGAIKRFCLGQRGGIPHFLGDLLRYSALWTSNRKPL
jgi:N-acetylglucosaminyl-diphospho-decaprenol L-rhamnosyltransferase